MTTILNTFHNDLKKTKIQPFNLKLDPSMISIRLVQRKDKERYQF